MTGSAPAASRRSEVVRVDALEDETFEQTLSRFKSKVHQEYRRPWYKRRYGYYEKPSVLHRKKRRMESRNNIRIRRGHKGLKLYIGLEAQFASDGPDAMGR